MGMDLLSHSVDELLSCVIHYTDFDIVYKMHRLGITSIMISSDNSVFYKVFDFYICSSKLDSYITSEYIRALESLLGLGITISSNMFTVSVLDSGIVITFNKSDNRICDNISRDVDLLVNNMKRSPFKVHYIVYCEDIMCIIFQAMILRRYSNIKVSVDGSRVSCSLSWSMKWDI